MKKPNSTKFKLTKLIMMICTLAVFCSGCGSLLTYNGADFDKERLKIVQTNESMVFSTYRKEVDGLSVRMGISKASIQGVLVLYAELTNTSDEDYYFNAKDLKVTTGNETVPAINPSEYLHALQGEQTEMIASMQAMAPTLRSIATISNNSYSNDMRSATAEHMANDSTTKDIADLVRGISLHSISSSATVKSGAKKYFYLFYQDMDTFPVEVTYGDLKYSFMGKSLSSKFEEL